MTSTDPLGGFEPIDPFEAGLAAAAGQGIDAVARGRADRGFTRAGRVRSAVRVVSGSHDGLSGSWRQGKATVSRRRLEFRRRWSLISGRPSVVVDVHAVHGPPRMPADGEIMKLPGPVVQIQTGTALLEWAVPSRYRSAALARLRVAYLTPEDD